MLAKNVFRLVISMSLLLFAFTNEKDTAHAYPKIIKSDNKLFAERDTTPGLSSFLVISDIHLNSGVSQDAARGDTGDSLWTAAKKEIDTLIATEHPKFIIVLGDLPKHDDSTKKDSNNVRRNMRQAINWFKDSAAIPATVPLLYVPGNNDSWNGDYSAFTLPDSVYRLSGYPFMHIDSTLSPGRACIANESLQKNIGCYAIYPLGTAYKIKLIVLNTILFTRNKVLHYSTDPNQQATDANTEINWLMVQLQQAAQSDEKVLIAMHVPPGIDGYAGTDMWYDKNTENIFLKAVEKYQHTICGLLAGHTHMDGVRLLLDSSGHVDALLLAAAGVAPGHGNNPGMKLVAYNDNDYALKDFTEYYMNFWNADKKWTLRDWDSSFSFSSIAPAYDISSMSMLDWFQKNNKDAIGKLADAIYTDKSNKPVKNTFLNEISSSIYAGYRK